MMKMLRISAAVALAGLTLTISPMAHAQKAPAADKAAKPAASAPAATTAAKPASVCKGLEEPACGKNAECIWRAASTRKNGSAVKAHCRKKPDIAKAQAAKEAKKAAAAAAPAVKSTAPAAKAAAPAAKTTAPAASTTTAPAEVKKAAKKVTPPPAPAAPAAKTN